MPLHWDIGNIKDYKTVCYHPTLKEDGVGEGTSYHDTPLKVVTSTLINLTMNLGISNWTDKNIEEVILRLRMYEGIYGKLVYNIDTGENSLTNEVIRQHVGLHTNGGSFSFPQFKTHCIKTMERRAKELIEWDDRDREEAA
jgi:hypothetical protein